MPPADAGDRVVYVAGLVADPEMQSIRPRDNYRSPANVHGSPAPLAMLFPAQVKPEPGWLSDFRSGWRRDYDYIALLLINCAPVPTKIPTGLTLLGSSTTYAFYRIDKVWRTGP